MPVQTVFVGKNGINLHIIPICIHPRSVTPSTRLILLSLYVPSETFTIVGVDPHSCKIAAERQTFGDYCDSGLASSPPFAAGDRDKNEQQYQKKNKNLCAGIGTGFITSRKTSHYLSPSSLILPVKVYMGTGTKVYTF